MRSSHFNAMEYLTTYGDRNDGLDCRVYSRAAPAVAGMDRYTDATWKTIEDNIAELAKTGGPTGGADDEPAPTIDASRETPRPRPVLCERSTAAPLVAPSFELPFRSPFPLVATMSEWVQFEIHRLN
jgi:hypothetical protein